MPLYDFACDGCGTRFEPGATRGRIAGGGLPAVWWHPLGRELSLPAAPVNGSQELPTACGSGPPCGSAVVPAKG